jgi:hypothetical protein
MKKLILALTLIVFSIKSVSGQKDSKDSSTFKKNQGHLYFGVQSPGIKELISFLNNSTLSNNYPVLGTNFFSAGVGFIQLTKNKFVSHQELIAYNSTASNDSVSVNFRNICFSLSILGYSYLNSKNFQSYSFMGLTYSTSTLKISENVADGTSFNNYGSSVGNQLEMNTTSFLLNITTQFNYLINFRKSDNKFIIGLKGSYYMPFTKSTWETGKTKLTEGPNINAGGLSAHLTLGMTF